MNTELLKKLRTDKGLTRRDVSNETGLTENQIYALETGRSDNPTLNTINALAKFYEVPVSDLIEQK